MTDPVVPAPAAPVSQPKKPVTPIRWSFIAAWAVAAFAVLLALFAWLPWIYPNAGKMTPFGRLQPTAAAVTNSDASRIAALEEKIATLSAQPETTAPVIDIDAIKADSIKAATEAATQSATQAATLAATQAATQVAGAAASEAAHSVAINAVAPLLTAGRLEDRLARGAAYQTELESLNPILNEAEKADLAPLAAGGPDNDALATQLDIKERTLLAAYRESLAVGWWDKIRARLSGIISITGPDSSPDGAGAAYAKLRAQITQDDATGALATLRMLPQSLRDGLQPVDTALAARARAKAALSNALTRLTATMMQPVKVDAAKDSAAH